MNPVKYESTKASNPLENPSRTPIRTPILRSPPPIQDPLDIKYCKKKKEKRIPEPKIISVIPGDPKIKMFETTAMMIAGIENLSGIS